MWSNYVLINKNKILNGDHMIDFSNVQETDWLTKGVSEKQLQKEKRQVLNRITRMEHKRRIVKLLKQYINKLLRGNYENN